jgi:hypothetical protein
LSGKKIPDLSLVPSGTPASQLFLETARQISAGVWAGESERIGATDFVALLAAAGASLSVNITSLLNDRGTYSPSATYTRYDFVAYGGGHYAYVNGTPGSGNAPPNVAYWVLISVDGKSAIATITDATPAPIPAVGSQATYGVDSSAGMVVGQIIGIGAASTLSVVATSTTTSITVQNVDAAVGPVATGAKIAAAGKRGFDSTVPGPPGPPAFTTVSLGFTIPPYNTQLSITVESTAFMAVDMALQISGKFFRVYTAPTNATTVVITNTVQGQTGQIAQFAKVAPAGEAGPAGTPGTPGTSSGGVGGLQYTYLNTAGTPSAGQIRSADINYIGASTVTISATDAQTTPKSTADVLARLKIGAIIEIAASNANKVRGTISANYSSGTNSFNWDSQIVSGSITNNVTVYLSIVSDPVSAVSGGGHGIRDEGIDLPQRGKIDFVGAGVTATDDAAGDRTVVTIAASGGGGAVLSLPYQSSDPAAVTGTLIIFARANGNPHMRKDDGTVYPISFGAAVAAITGIVVGTSGPVIGSQPPGVSSPYYKILAASGDGLYSGGFATRNGVDIHSGWPSVATSYILTASGVKAAAGSVSLWVRTNGANPTEALLYQFAPTGHVYGYKLIGSTYSAISDDLYDLPIGSFSIFARVTPTSISIGDGIFFKTIMNSDYASNVGVGYSLQGSDGTKIANFPTLTYSPYLIDDTFTDTTGTLLTAHTSEVGKWLTLFGFPSLKITASGRAIASTATGGNIQNAMATSYTITTNYQVELVTGKTMAIIFRSGLGQAALPNYCLFQIVDGFASFYSQTSGILTLISQIAFNYPTGGQVDIKIVVTPTTLTAIADDGDIYLNQTILSANNSTHATQPGVGLYASIDPNYTLGDFRVVA